MIETYYIKSYGCAMNIADSNKIRTLLNQYSLKETKSWEDAQLIILVTCSIRQQAEDKVTGWGIKASEKLFSDKTILMIGCMAQRYDRNKNQTIKQYEDILRKRFPWITHILNIKDINKLPKLLALQDTNLINSDLITRDINNKYQGLFSISEGCDNFCSYCIVPYTRGKLVNFPKEQILDEIKNFVDTGGKLITLLGQNVNSWKCDDNDFVDLLKDIEAIKGEFWINFLSSHPKDFSDELIELITTHDKFLKHSNIAVQSGSDRILKLMNRKYTKEKFLDICKKIKRLNPEFRITTDIIVGFPTESEEDFKESMELIKVAEIEMAYIGKFSPRKGSKAYQMIDNVSLDIKRERERELGQAVNRIRNKKHQDSIGKVLKVLITSKNKGITYYNNEILLNTNYPIGTIQSIKITGCSRSGIIG